MTKKPNPSKQKLAPSEAKEIVKQWWNEQAPIDKAAYALVGWHCFIIVQVFVIVAIFKLIEHV